VKALAAIALIAAVVALVLMTRPTRVQRAPDSPASPSASSSASDPDSRSAPPISSDAATRPTPQSTVALQLRLLDARDLPAFRATFLPAVAATITPDMMEACRTRVHQVPVLPDWEMAEDSTSPESGLRIRRVSMFGKSMTGFHEQADGRWLADAVWCLPVGLP
jgi:hypothetical protein